MARFTHTITGRTFIGTGEGPFGASSVAGTWDSGEAGVIFPGDTLKDGSALWEPTAA